MADFQMLGDNSLKNVLERFEKNLLTKLNCAKVGKIKTFYANTQTADIEIDNYPQISGVPVSFICGANFSIQVPIEQGDDCIVLFCDGDLDNWVNGEGYIPAFSQDRHGLNGAVALVGIKNILTKVDNYITSGIRIQYKGSEIELTDTDIKINGTSVVVNQGVLKVDGAASGTFVSQDGKVVTVIDGIVTNIV